MATTIKISEAALAVLARSTITATTVALPPEQLERPLYVEVDKALRAAGGKWSKGKRVHEFTRDPREALGLTLATGTAVKHQQVRQAFYTPPELADRLVEVADVGPGHTVIVRGSTLTLVLGDWREHLEIHGGAETVRMDGGHRRIVWSASKDPGSHVDFVVSWLNRDGWHVHATGRGGGPDLVLSTVWREGGGVCVELRAAGTGTVGLIELRRIDP